MSTYNKLLTILGLTALTVLCGCISNDIPYPRIQANFASFEVEGQIQATGIDSINRSLTVYLDETVDIQSVRLKSFVTTPAGVTWADSATFASGIDLSKPVTTTLRLYQDYSWVVSAVQNIDRYFTVANQIGASTIDVPGRRVVAYVPMQANITAIEVLTMKLAGPETTYSPEITGKRIDFSTPFELTVTEHGRSENGLSTCFRPTPASYSRALTHGLTSHGSTHRPKPDAITASNTAGPILRNGLRCPTNGFLSPAAQ